MSLFARTGAKTLSGFDLRLKKRKKKKEDKAKFGQLVHNEHKRKKRRFTNLRSSRDIIIHGKRQFSTSFPLPRFLLPPYPPKK